MGRKLLAVICVLSAIALVALLLLTAFAMLCAPAIAAVLFSLPTMGNQPVTINPPDYSGYLTSPMFFATLGCALCFAASCIGLRITRKKN